jgi:tetratricopeptide (TPR) repeat protein
MKTTVLLLMLGVFGVQSIQAQTPPVPEAPYGLGSAEVYGIFQSEYSNIMRPNTRKTLEDFDLLLMYGRWLLIAHPKSITIGRQEIKGDRTFDRMINVYTEMSKIPADPIMKSAYLDTASALFERVLTIFTPEEIDEFKWRYDYGRFLLANTALSNGQQRAYDQYMILFDKNTERLTKDADGFYAQFIASYLMSENRNDDAIAFMEKAQPFADAATIEAFNGHRDRLFRNPEDRIVFLESLLEKEPGNLDTMGQLYDLYLRVNNREKSKATAEALYAAAPDFANTRRMGLMASGSANYRDAIRYMEEALTKTTDNNDTKLVSMDLANLFRNIDNLQRAREYARKASAIDPAWGEPNLTMAQVYAQAVTDCAGGQLTRTDKVVYWLILDYLDKARTDQSVRTSVDRYYAQYERSAPTVEDKFYQNWTTGATIRVDRSLRECYAWINESTRVR